MARAPLVLCLALSALAAPALAFHAPAPAGLRTRTASGLDAAARTAGQAAPGLRRPGALAPILRAVLSRESATANQIFTVDCGDRVRVQFCGKTDDGTTVVKSRQGVADSIFGARRAKGREPMKEEFDVGGGEVARKCEQALIGLREGDIAEVRLSPAEAYGERLEEHVYTITKDMVGAPEDMPFPVGTTFKLKGGLEARVTEEDGKWVVLDANHELAGSHITFHIMIHEILKQGCDAPLCEIEEISFLEDS